jgi:hypothetical protein
MQYKRLTKIVMPLLLASAVATSLWFASPQTVEALNVNFSLPSSGTLGQTYSFSVTIDIEAQDVLPLQGAKLEILNASDTVVASCNDLPTADGTKGYTTTDTGNGAISVVATTSGTWAYSYSDNRVAYWDGTPYYFGYGYGYGSAGATITYAVTWTTPLNLGAGNYSIMVTITGNSGTSTTFSKESSTFSLVQQSTGGGGGGGGGGGPSGPGITSLAPYINADGVFNLDAIAKSEDGNVELVFTRGIQAKNRDGGALKSVSIKKMAEPPAAPADTSIIGLVYEFGPAGATFSPPITLTFHYDASGLPQGMDENKLVLATWDETSGKWVELQCSVDTTNHTISVSIEHLSIYTIIAHTRPASLKLSGLTVSPNEVEPGQSVSINVKISNSGDLSGTHDVNLKVNGVSEETKRITVAGGETQTVYFSLVRNGPGKYSVDINGLTGEFSVISVVPPTTTFSIGKLIISPAEAELGDIITISATISNTGEYDGIYHARLKINGVVMVTKEVSVNAGDSEVVSFDTSQDKEGVYTVEIGEASGTFTVKASQSVSPRVINWWLIGGCIVIVIAVATFVVLGIRRSSGSSNVPPTPPRIDG